MQNIKIYFGVKFALQKFVKNIRKKKRAIQPWIDIE